MADPFILAALRTHKRVRITTPYEVVSTVCIFAIELMEKGVPWHRVVVSNKAIPEWREQGVDTVDAVAKTTIKIIRTSAFSVLTNVRV